MPTAIARRLDRRGSHGVGYHSAMSDGSHARDPRRQLSAWLPAVIDIADAAGREIMRIYQTAFNVTLKQDRSPLTEADLAAQRIIAAGLKALTPEIAMLGEESAPQQFEHRRDWPRAVAGRSARWHARVRQAQRRIHRQYRPGRARRAGARRRAMRPARGVLYARRARLRRVPARRRRRAHADPCPRARPPQPLRILGSRSHGDAVLDRMLERLGRARAHQRRQRAEVRPAGRGQRRPVRASRPDLRMGHRSRTGRGARSRWLRGRSRRRTAALQRA